MCKGSSDTFLYTNTYSQSHLLRITFFYLRLPCRGPPFPDYLTLVYLPRISEAELEINGVKVRPDSPAFLTLHRVVKDGDDGVAYWCRDKVRAGSGLLFEVYIEEEKLLKGTFRKDGKEGWEVECRCVMEKDTSVVREGEMAEVFVGVEGEGEGGYKKIRETVRMVVKSKSRRGKGIRGFRNGLEEIPEESEEERDGDDEACEGDQCSCCSHGEEEEGGYDYEYEYEVNTDGVKWAVDVGIWVICFGVGFFFSKASSSSSTSKKLTRRR